MSVAVTGDDLLATHLVQVAALAGGEVVIHAGADAARDHAFDLGAEHALDPAAGPLAPQVRAELGDGVDRVLLAGDEVDLATAVAALRPGGRVVVVDGPDLGTGMVPLAALVDDELDVVGATGSTAQDVAELFDLAAEGRLVTATSIGATLPVDDLGAIVTALGQPGAAATRVAVTLPR